MFTQANPSVPGVPLARGGPITDDVLTGILPEARAAAADDAVITPALGRLMIMTYAAMAEELLAHRRRLSMIRDCADPANVVLLRPEAT